MKKIIFILFFLHLFLYSNTIELNNQKTINILENSNIYYEKETKLTIYHISKLKNKFNKSNISALQEGFSKTKIWMHFKLENKTTSKVVKTIHINKPIFEAITIYEKISEDNYKILESKSFKRVLNPTAQIDVESNEIKEFYISIKTDIMPLNASIFLQDIGDIYYENIVHQLFLTLFFGGIITFIFYNLLLAVFARSSSYLYYSCYFATLLIYYSYYTNMYLYLIDYHFTFIGSYLLSFLIIFLLLFTKSLLNLKIYPKISISFNIIIFILLIIMIFTNENFYPISILVVLLLSIMFYMLLVSYYLLYKKNEEAKFFVVGWTIATMGYILFALKNSSYLELIGIFTYIYELSILAEALLFSMALANKLNKTKALEVALHKNKILTKELHHRVKNNMQIIISMYRLKLDIDEFPNIDEKLNELETTVQAISKTHSLLFEQENLHQLDAKAYISTLIKELNASFNKLHIKIEESIKLTLQTQEAIYCGIIINELLTNAHKHAFKDTSNPEVKIELFLKSNKKHLIIWDNGSGFDKVDMTQNSFGLEFIKAIVEGDLKGEFLIQNKRGTKVEIIF